MRGEQKPARRSEAVKGEHTRPKKGLMNILKVMKPLVDAPMSKISSELRDRLPNPLTNEGAYHEMTEKLFEYARVSLELQVEKKGKKIPLEVLRNELDAFFEPPFPQMGLGMAPGCSSTMGWENRKGGR